MRTLVQILDLFFLGRSNTTDTEELKNFLEDKKLLDCCKFFDAFVDWNSFLSYISDSDLLMPLIHHSTPNYEDYHSKHISGTFNLSFGLKIPMIIEQSFAYIEDFQNSSIFYTIDKVQHIINDIYPRKEKIAELKRNIANNPKFSLESQSQNYLNHIFS